MIRDWISLFHLLLRNICSILKIYKGALQYFALITDNMNK